MSESRLVVTLYGKRLGVLVRQRGGGSTFVPEPSWVAQNFQPLLGVHWLIKLGTGERHANTHLPEWFENLLPERDSVLRERLARAAGLRGTASYDLLARLGHDLPGAVVIAPEGEISEEEGAPEQISDPSMLRFSLAGMQLKFSVSLREGKLSLPARNEDGSWIVKLATGDIPGLSEVEFATMNWASRCGFEVPDRRLLPVREVEWLAPLASSDDELAFVIRRYDRTEEGRIHQEDFAQVLGVGPTHKYADGSQKTGHDGLGRLVRDTCGEEQAIEYIRRLVFVIASGNTDAHLKNWSFLLPPGQRPRLAPLYDQVCVVAWAQRFGWSRPDQQRPELALALGGSRRLSDLSFERFHPLAERVGLSHADMDALVKRTLERIFSALPGIAMPDWMRGALVEHARGVRLLFDFADFG